MNSQNVMSLVGGALIALAIILLSRACDPEPHPTIITKDTVRHTDTLYRTLPPVVVRKPAKVIYIDRDRAYDTVHFADTVMASIPFDTCLPFVAYGDTVMPNGDTVHVLYQSSLQDFTIAVNYAPDTTFRTMETINTVAIVEDEQAWWVEPAKIGGSLLLGILLGRSMPR